MVSVFKSQQWLVSAGVPQGSGLEPVLFNIMNDMYKGIKCIVSKLTYYAKLGMSVDLLQGRKPLQRDLYRLDQRAEVN